MKTRTMIRTALALGFSMLALNTTAWATNPSCSLGKLAVRYYSSPVDTYHHKRVIAYCESYERPVSCEAEVFTSSHHPDERPKYFVALNEVHPYYQDKWRTGCWGRANTFQASYEGYHGEELGEASIVQDDFYWGLRVYATCVPKDCAGTYQGSGHYEYYQPED